MLAQKDTVNPIIKQIIDDHPAYSFVMGDQFAWSPVQQQIVMDKKLIYTRHGSSSLLHELSHATLGHKTYADDVQLLMMEVLAWQAAKKKATMYEFIIDDGHIENCLESYRIWLHKRSQCVECQERCLPTATNSYRCHNCSAEWRVSDSRFCAIRRNRIA